MIVPAEFTDHNTLKVKEVKFPKKITGTKLANILGKNPYSTPFSTWCDMLHAYEFPFEETMFTIAGKTIEPYQSVYANQIYHNVVSPEDKFGKDYFQKTHGNFFDDEHFGGMWDYLQVQDGKITAVFEMKTASEKKREIWLNEIPEHYALQAALYAYLLGIEKVIMVASFLKFQDYKAPQMYLPNKLNTICIEFMLHERYPNFEEEYIKPALEWWDKYVVTGESPQISEKDLELVKEIKKSMEENLVLIEQPTMTQLEQGISSAMKEVEENVTYFNSIADNVTEAYTSDLDEIMADAYQEVILVDEPSDAVLEKYFLKLTNTLYFVGARAEKLGVYSDVSKASAKEAYNKAYLDNQNKVGTVDGKKASKPTVAENQAIAENASIYNSTVNTIYDRSYKILRFKIDAAYEMVKTLSKIISKRMQDSSKEYNQDSNLTFLKSDNII